MPSDLPPCGLYRTTQPIGDVPAGRLVYFHNHGNPGPGVYVPERWTANRAHFSPKGITLPPDFAPAWLEPLPREGFYRVVASFHCCAKKCVEFKPDMFVQLGYNSAGRALVFLPELAGSEIDLPTSGTFVDDDVLANLQPLRIRERAASSADLSVPRGIIVH